MLSEVETSVPKILRQAQDDIRVHAVMLGNRTGGFTAQDDIRIAELLQYSLFSAGKPSAA